MVKLRKVLSKQSVRECLANVEKPIQQKQCDKLLSIAKLST